MLKQRRVKMTDTLTTAADTVQAAASAAGSSGDPLFLTIMKAVSMYAIPLVLLAVPVIGVIKKLKVYEVFTEGAKEGFETAVKIIPYLVAMLVAIGMFRASGAMDFLVSALSPVTNLIGMPAEVLPAALMRPLSGSGTLGIVTDLINHHGADSLIGRIASTMFGSTETTFYVLAVYFGSVGISKSRHAVIAGLIGDVVGLLAAVLICRVVFI
jgi:spore maturation protein B